MEFTWDGEGLRPKNVSQPVSGLENHMVDIQSIHYISGDQPKKNVSFLCYWQSSFQYRESSIPPIS